MSSHARLSPSNTRWPKCPGSVREEAAYPDVSGEAAIDGTGSHLLLELCLQNGVRAATYDGQIIGANHDSFDYDMILDNSVLIIDTRGVYRDEYENVIRA